MNEACTMLLERERLNKGGDCGPGENEESRTAWRTISGMELAVLLAPAAPANSPDVVGIPLTPAKGIVRVSRRPATTQSRRA